VIVDTSAVIAILQAEPEAEAYLRAIAEHPPCRMSAASYVEAGIILDRSTDPLERARLDDLLARLSIGVEPVTEAQARIARQAYRDFGRGSGHRARLNYGDCFAYALARDKGEALLYKGADFDETEVPFIGRRAERNRISELLATYG
jgi:ribonuclease VapC